MIQEYRDRCHRRPIWRRKSPSGPTTRATQTLRSCSPPARSNPSRYLTDSHLDRYELEHRVHAAKVYPVKSPNGSTIVVYAHDRGIRFVWRGGRPLKQHVETQQSRQVNGHTSGEHDVDMVDDEEDDDLRTTIDDFEAQEDEQDPSAPYPHIVDSFDLQLKSPALHIAIPPLSSTLKAEDGHWVDEHRPGDVPQIFRQDIIVAITCRDSSVRLITVPLIPPRPRHGSTTRDHSFEEVVVSLPQARTSLRSIPRGISMTWKENLNRASTTSPGASSGQRSPSPEDLNQHRCTLLLATITSEARGMLKVFGVPVICKRIWSTIDADAASLLRSELLSSEPQTVTFKPSTHLSPNHQHILLSEQRGAVRLYDPQLATNARAGTGGRFLSAFYVPFENPDGSGQKQRILDVAWVLSGACILALLANGQWGVWDIEGAAPGASTGLINGAGASSISGGAVTPFTLRGSIGTSPSSRSDRLSRGSDSEGEREPKRLAPMTPNTRKTKQDKLFSQSSTAAASSAPSSSIVQGGTSITSTPSMASQEQNDSSIIFWYKSEVYSIPSLRAYWARAAKKMATAGNRQSELSVEGALHGSNISPLSVVSTGGQLITSISQLAKPSKHPQAIPGALRYETLVSAEYRLLYVKPPTDQTPNTEQDMDRLFYPPRESLPVASRPQTSRTDQDLLARGDLDLGGVDRMLNGMDSGPPLDDDPFMMSGALQPAQRRVGFAAEY